MLNIALPRLDMYKDVATFNSFRLLSKLMPKAAAFRIVQQRSRENARTPMQWSDDAFAGFSSRNPWFYVNPNYHEINVENEEKDPNSILHFYRKLLRFRKDNPIVIYGSYRELMEKDEQLYVYERLWQGRKLLVICSFTNELVRFELPEEYPLDKGRLVLSNYEHNFIIANGFTTRPYELRVYMFEENP